MPDSPQPHRTSPAAGDQIGILRILDAAANRAAEGLRVIEDYVRFVLDDRYLTELCKQLRHDLAEHLARTPCADRHAARDTLRDVGTLVATAAEQIRADAAAVLAASCQRLQQALRSLEEYSKIIDPPLAAGFEQLRYRAYTIERATTITLQSLERLKAVRLCVLVDGRKSADDLGQWLTPLLEAGVGMVQLREKGLADRALLERAQTVRALTRQRGAVFIMNDRADLALISQADGVHLGQDDLSVRDARAIVGPAAIVGVSTHSLDQAHQAVLDGANYIGVGPTFPSGTKTFAGYPGVELLRAVAAEVRLPAFAIGGVTAANLPDVLAAGMKRAAVSSAVSMADDPAEAVRGLMAKLSGGC